MLRAGLLIGWCVVAMMLLNAQADEAGEAQPSKVVLKSDPAGHLHINTSSPDQDVFVNGVSFSQLAQNVVELNQAVTSLQATVDNLLASVAALQEAQPQQSEIADVVTVHDDAVYISAKNGVFLSSGAAHVINEASTSWNPSSLDCNVGDRVTFKWSSLEAVYETQADGSTAVQGGYNSGDATLGGEFTVWLNEEKTYKFRAANKGSVLTVNTFPVGMTPGDRRMRVGGMVGSRIIGTGERNTAGNACIRLTGAMYSFHGCKCNEGTLMHVYSFFYMCLV